MKAMTREIRELVKIAKSSGDVVNVSHVFTRAYCVAKPAKQWALFAVPTVDREPQVKNDKWVSISHESCLEVEAGEWASIAYVCTKTTGENVVLKRLI